MGQINRYDNMLGVGLIVTGVTLTVISLITWITKSKKVKSKKGIN